MMLLHLLKSSISNNSFLTLVVASIFLASVGMISHNAFAMGAQPGSCVNEYDGPITVAKINNGTQTFDLLANPGATFQLPYQGRYYLLFIVHTPSQDRQGNSYPGTVWANTSLNGFYQGGCNSGAGPNQNYTMYLDRSCNSGNNCETYTTWGTTVNGFSYGTNFVAPKNTTIDSTTPNPPTNITPTPVSASQIDLMWNAPINSSATGYKIERSTNQDAWSTIVSNTNSTTTMYFDSGLQQHTVYYYRVSAINSIGISLFSNTAYATTDTTAIAPGSPTGLAATNGNSRISLSWTAPSTNGSSAITGYNVYRSTTSGGEGSTPYASGIISTTYDDTTVTNGQEYFYKVTAVNSAGESSQSNEANATPMTKHQTIEFSSSTTFTGTVNASTTMIIDKGVTVTSNGITNYGNITNYGTITMNSSGTKVLDNHGMILNMPSGQFSSATINNYQSANMTNQNSNQYQQGVFFLTSLNNHGNYTTSGGIQSYYATITNYATGIIESHNDNIMYGAGLNNYGKVDSFGGDTLYFADIYNNGTFNNHSTLSISSDQASEGIVNDVSGIFNNLAGSGVSIPGRTGGYDKHFDNSGTVNNDGSFFNENHISSSGTFNNNGTITIGSPEVAFPSPAFTNSGKFYNMLHGRISNGGTFNNECKSIYDNSGTFSGNLVTYNCRPVPQNLHASAGSSHVLLSWTAPVSNSTYSVTNYEVYRAANSGEETLLAQAGNVTSYNDTMVTNGQTYYYEVSAANSTGQSPFSNEVSAMPVTSSTTPSAPTALSAATTSSSQINLSWTAPSNNGGSSIIGYQIQRSTDNGTTWSTIQSNTGTTSTTYNDTGLAPSTTYTYQVSAINSVGTSTPSNTASATTSSGTTTGSIVLNNVQSTSGTVSSSPYQMTLANFNAGTGTNRLLVVGVQANNNNVASITFGGVPLTKKVSTFSNNDAEFWYLKNPSGTGNIVVTMAGSTSVVVGAYSFSGVDQTTPIPTSTANHNTSPSSPTVSITTQNPNSWVLDSASIYGGITLGSPTCTQQWDTKIASAITGASSSMLQASAGPVTCSWTASSGDMWDDAAVEVMASGTGAGTTTTTAPRSPAGLTATVSSSSQINLSWTAPSSNGGSAITGYKIERSTDGGTTWSTIQSNTASVSTTYSDTGLASSTAYTYRVSAINGIGTSSPSNTASATTSSNVSTGIVLSNTQSTSGTASNTITISGFNAGSDSNRLLVVGVAANNNNVASITFGGVALQNIASSFYNNDAEFWYLKNPSGTGDVVVTMNGQTQAVVGAYAFSGVNQTVPIPTHVTNHNTSPNSPKISITTKYANDWVLDLPSIYGGSRLFTPTCTQQWDANVPSAITGASSSTMVSSPGAVTCGWTASSADLYDDVAVEINAVR